MSFYPICFENIQNDKKKILKCSHYTCNESWENIENYSVLDVNCPICRIKIKDKNETEYNEYFFENDANNLNTEDNDTLTEIKRPCI